MKNQSFVDVLNSANSIPEAFYQRSKSHPNELVYSQAFLCGEGSLSDKGSLSSKGPLSFKGSEAEKIHRSWKGKTYLEVEKRIRSITQYLVGIGIKKGDKVAIISNTRPEWLEVDIAVLSLGAVVVSVYQSLLANDIGYILFDSGARVAFVENEEQVEKLEYLSKNEIDIPATEDREACKKTIEIQHIVSFEETSKSNVTTLQNIFSSESKALEVTLEAISRKDLAALVYTSGTTGPPKGVMQTHGNHLSNVRQAAEAKLYSDNSAIVLILPLAHSFAKLMGYIGFLTGAEVKFPAVVNTKSSKLNADSLTRDIREAGADIIPPVPRMIEKMKEAVVRRSEGPSLLARLLRATFQCATKRMEAIETNTSLAIGVKLGHILLTPLRTTIRKKLFGARFGFVISGGAKLDPAVARFFQSIGISILEGYGLTETCVATNVNRFESNGIGTVGPVLSADIELKIAEDGEILYRGPNVTQGYYQRPTATAASWDKDGWFHTGDLGEVDSRGFLKITGRKKEILVTAGGKKIAPDPIEQKLRAVSLISQAVLVGEGRPYCCVLITLNYPVVKQWIKSSGLGESTDRLQDPQVKEKLSAEIWKAVQGVNKTLASFESIKRIEILDEDFTLENGLLTPTLKVKRKEVVRRNESLIASMYQKLVNSGLPINFFKIDWRRVYN